MTRKTTLDEAIAAASAKPSACAPRKVKSMSQRGRPRSDTLAPASLPIHGPSEIAEMLGYQRDAVYEWEKRGLERAVGGKGFRLPDVVRWLMSRERAAGRMEADPEDVLEAEKLRDLRARADMREDERDLQRKKLIETELAIAIYQDDCAHVASHLRGMGARLMQTLAIEEDADVIRGIVDEDVEQALNNLAAEHVDPTSPDRHPYLGGTGIAGRS
jgi:hypothetical protein